MAGDHGHYRAALAAFFLLATGMDAAAEEAETAAANAAKDEPLAIETIIVTGEKVKRSILDTASSVMAFDEREIARRPGLESANDILDRIPNLVTSETSNLAPAVRGADGTGPAQGADAFFAGTRPRLNYQVDGRTLSYNESIFSDSTLWDVERVEVYRGPQSTLQGRNSIGGAIVVKTKDPTYDVEGAGRLAAGSYGTRQASAALSGPIVDNQLAARLSFDTRRSDSFIENFTPYVQQDHPERYESTMARGKLLIEPAGIPDLSTLLTFSYLDAHAPQDNGVIRPYADHITYYPAMNVFETRAKTGIADTNWRINDLFSLQTVLSATDVHVRRYGVPGDGNATIDASEYMAEPRLGFSFYEDRLNGFVGLHLFHNAQDEFIDIFGGGTFEDRVDTAAIFGETTLKVTDSVDLTLGGRLEREHHKRVGGVAALDFGGGFIVGPFNIDLDKTYEEALPKAGIAWHIDRNLTVGATISRGYNGGGAGFTYDTPYESYTYDPEYVWNYEVYSRASLLGGRLTLTGNAFYDRYRDMQLPFDLNPDPTVWSYVVRNADEAVTYGLEVGTRFLVQPGFEVFADAAFLKTRIESYPGSGVEGNALPRSPAFSLDFGGSYAHESGVEISADTRFTDAYYSDVVHTPRGKTDPYWVTNAQIAYRLGGARLFASVTNLFDRVEPVLLTPGTVAASDIANLLQPRTATVGIEYVF